MVPAITRTYAHRRDPGGAIARSNLPSAAADLGVEERGDERQMRLAETATRWARKVFPAH
jgi:hypothetical protein